MPSCGSLSTQGYWRSRGHVHLLGPRSGRRNQPRGQISRPDEGEAQEGRCFEVGTTGLRSSEAGSTHPRLTDPDIRGVQSAANKGREGL